MADAGSTATSYDGIRNMTSPNYSYDKLGQLTRDLQEGISKFIWRYGDKKLKAMETSLPDKAELEFVYNPLGQRVLKIIKPKVAGDLEPESAWTYVYYAYDANGQVMATYEVAYGTYNTTKLNEQMIYGLGRLGCRDVNMLIHTSQFALPAQGDIYVNTLGKKRYEMTNHLSDVVTVISDRKLATSGGTPSTYESVILMKNDYYPFGMVMPGRNLNISSYRYGFQGQEIDNEIKGDGNSVNYEFRMYDPRIGRFFIVDPLAAQYPQWAPYVFSGNRIIDRVELEGLEPVQKLIEEGVKTTLTVVRGGASTGAAGAAGGSVVGGSAAGGPIGFLIGLNVYIWTEVGMRIYSHYDLAKAKEFIAKNQVRLDEALKKKVEAIIQFAPSAGLNEDEIRELIDLEGRSLNLSDDEKTKLFNLQQKLKKGVLARGSVESKETPWELPEGDKANHTFSGKPGKFADTPENRKHVENIANGDFDFSRVDEYGKLWFYKTVGDVQHFVYGRNGEIGGGGINSGDQIRKPSDFDKNGKLKDEFRKNPIRKNE